jgi:hypothetical protein
MIEFAIARTKRVLLIRFSSPATREALACFDRARRAMFAREGTMDFIVDFSASPRSETATTVMRERADLPSPAPNHRRIYVAPQDLLFGALRMYQIPHDDPLVLVTRSLAEALGMLNVAESDFELLPV